MKRDDPGKIKKAHSPDLVTRASLAFTPSVTFLLDAAPEVAVFAGAAAGGAATGAAGAAAVFLTILFYCRGGNERRGREEGGGEGKGHEEKTS